ncbi:hypothetical protein ES288_D07G118700v1 [Gossypium darwinii]|uniref:Uncharacterized protein n=1 Tax=Gossypium darwinii TaxID=34276 RepID=A0A5D2BZZ2_GOSDA|nr:hypothetical protein ES288_D07G118700v1 [Gossypium darwinii]
MNVSKYEKEFVRLSKYAQKLVTTESDMYRRFEWGLNEDLYVYVVGLNFEDFSSLVERAQRIEEGMKRQSDKNLGQRVATSSKAPSVTKKVRDLRESGNISFTSGQRSK